MTPQVIGINPSTGGLSDTSGLRLYQQLLVLTLNLMFTSK